MTTKHTKGPWHRGGQFKGHHAVHAEDGRVVALTGIVGAADDEESIANARLIAALPTVLKALRHCEFRLALLVESGRSKLLDAAAAENARAALAEATGEQA